MKSALVIAILKLLSWLPLPVARMLGALVGELMYLSNSSATKVSMMNIGCCFPELSAEQKKQLCRQRMRDLGVAACETPGLWRRSASWISEKIVGFHGMEHFKRAVESEKGAIMLLPHQGNWEAAGIWISVQTAITALYEPPKMEKVGDWIKAAREQAGAKVLPTNVRGVAAIVKALKRGESTIILPDQQPPASGGDFAPFYGTPARTMTLIYNLLQRSQCHALFATAIRVGGGWELHFLPVEEAIYSDDQATSLAALNRGVQSVIELNRAQYQWEYKRFRAQPDGTTNFYVKALKGAKG